MHHGAALRPATQTYSTTFVYGSQAKLTSGQHSLGEASPRVFHRATALSRDHTSEQLAICSAEGTEKALRVFIGNPIVLQ
mmetsp:Transcript_20238/g.47252  ORF Transcript_20238/g.47252 Transcript_20238/m.47252 type:complete len:80 (-) Transcript_20238:1530-1769(-)